MSRLFFVLLLIVFTGIFECVAQKKPVPVIFDTDIGPDYDDVGAIALLHAFADGGEAKILATTGSNQYSNIAAVLSVFNTYFNRPNIPVGVCKGKAPNLSCNQKWDSVIISKYPHAVRTNDDAMNAVALYRKTLAVQPDKSVTIITVGFFTNLADLLNSTPDQFSSLTGSELVNRKVKRLVSMAGRFPSGNEFNVDRNIPASKKVFADWPTEIVFSGWEIGSKIFSGLPLINNNAIQNSPVKDVFAISIPMNEQDRNGRMSWDETAVLIAVRGWEKYYSAHRGRIICNDDGSNLWNDKGKGHRYVVEKMPVQDVSALINRLIQHQPVKK